MPAGWEPEPRGARGPRAARPTFQVSLGQGGGSGAELREPESRSSGAGSGGASEGGRSRTHYLGSSCHPAGEPRSWPGREPFGPADSQHFRRSFYIASTSGLLPVRVPRCYLRTLKLFVAAQSTWHWAPFPGAWQPRFQLVHTLLCMEETPASTRTLACFVPLQIQEP